MGCDEYHSISKTGSNLTSDGGIGYGVIDAIDTMQIMGLDAEYNRARSWIERHLTFERDGNFNTFEVRTGFLPLSPIRMLRLVLFRRLYASLEDFCQLTIFPKMIHSS